MLLARASISYCYRVSEEGHRAANEGLSVLRKGYKSLSLNIYIYLLVLVGVLHRSKKLASASFVMATVSRMHARMYDFVSPRSGNTSISRPKKNQCPVFRAFSASTLLLGTLVGTCF